MANVKSLPELLDTLTSSLSSISSTLPSEENTTPANLGLSLLDTKNELLLTYLQNLVFLILLKIRHATGEHSQVSNSDKTSKIEKIDKDERSVFDETVRRLVELRVYLQRGVNPLEKKARDQLLRMVQAAEQYEERASRQHVSKGNSAAAKKDTIRIASKWSGADSDAGSDSESESGSSSEQDTDSDSDSGSEQALKTVQHSALRSNPASITPLSHSESEKQSNSRSVYKAPRITPVAPPSTTGSTRQQRPRTHRVMDEYISNELSGAPTSEPSIGANILERGRRDMMSAREQKAADERQRYEEENLIRLPSAGKKERQRLERERVKRDQFGGEEWSGLGGSADRILQLTKRGRSSAGALERSRKRVRDEESGDAGGIGKAFEKKRRLLEKRAAARKKT